MAAPQTQQVRPTRQKLWLDAENIGCVVAGVAAMLSLSFAVHRSSLPYQAEYEEGNILNAALRITRGLTPYPEPHSWPSIFSPYGPVPYGLTALVVKAGGVNFFWPRLLVLVAACVSALALAGILQRATGSWKPGVLFGSLFLTTPLVQQWDTYLRVDLIGIAFTAAGLYWFSRHSRSWCWPAIFFSLAIFTKYSLLSAPTACLLVLIWQRDWKRAAKFAAMTSAIVILAFVNMQKLTDGWFAFHMFRTHYGALMFGNLLRIVRFWTYPDPHSGLSRILPVILAMHVALLLLVLIYLRAGRKALPEARLWLVYFGCAAAVACITAAKNGANTNHFLEPMLALVIVAGLGFHSLKDSLTSSNMKALAVMLVALLAVVGSVTWRSTLINVFLEETPGHCAEPYQFVRNHPGAVLAEDVGMLLLAGKPVPVSNPFVYTQIQKHGDWVDSNLPESIRRKEYSAIVLWSLPDDDNASDHWPAPALRAIRENYHQTEGFFCDGGNVGLEPNR